jgi:hypothetical protein
LLLVVMHQVFKHAFVMLRGLCCYPAPVSAGIADGVVIALDADERACSEKRHKQSQ